MREIEKRATAAQRIDENSPGEGSLGAKEDTRGEILFIDPIFKEMIWGGDRLAREWGYKIPSNHTGECWAVSAHPHGDCVVTGGRYDAKHLSELWKENPELFGSIDGDRFPLLVKIIDAAKDLSIQVHPDDAYAYANENGSLGKTECWYILDASEGAQIVVGHNAKNRNELADMIKNGKWDSFLRYVPVKKGDFIQIDPGTVHNIVKGIEILEIQQNSELTYRVYDYDRITDGKKRELHVDKSIDVITVPAKSVSDSVVKAEEIAGRSKKNKLNLLIACDCYRVWQLETEGYAEFEQDQPFLMMSVVEGDGYINGQYIRKGDHFILPNGYGTVGLRGVMKIIASSVSL